jgi:hypothetical protein
MKRLQRESVIIELADQLRAYGSWCGETNIQKATYFLQTLFDPELEFDFILHRHGPFSFELRDELLSMRGDGLLKLEPANPYGPRIKPTDTGSTQDDLSANTGPSARGNRVLADDPLLTMRSDRRLVATGRNGFGLFEPLSGLSHLPRVATGCDRLAP